MLARWEGSSPSPRSYDFIARTRLSCSYYLLIRMSDERRLGRCRPPYLALRHNEQESEAEYSVPREYDCFKTVQGQSPHASYVLRH